MAQTSIPKILDRLFDRYDPNNTGKVSSRHLLEMVDNLDDAMPAEADPVMTEDNRVQAQTLVDADLTMTRDELDMHLADFGVKLAPERPSSRAPPSRSRLPLPRTGSASSSGGGSSPAPTNRPTLASVQTESSLPSRIARRPSRPDKSFAELSEISMIPQSPSLMKQSAGRNGNGAATKETRTGTSQPLAQSTPRRPASSGYIQTDLTGVAEKENAQPTASSSSSPYGSDHHSNQSFTRPMSQGRQASFSERFGNRGTPTSPSTRLEHPPAPPREIPSLVLLQEHIREMQSKVKQQAQTIDMGELRIQELERQVEEATVALQTRMREATDLKAAKEASDRQVQRLELDLDNAQSDKAALQQRVGLAQVELAEHKAALEHARAGQTQDETALQILREQTAAAVADRDKWQEEVKVLKATANGLQIQVDQLLATEARLENAEEACSRYEEQVQALRSERDEALRELANKEMLMQRPGSPLARVRDEIQEKPVMVDKHVQAVPEVRMRQTQTMRQRSQSVSRLVQTDAQVLPSGPPPDYPAQWNAQVQTEEDERQRQRDMAEIANQLGVQQSLLEKLSALQKRQREQAQQQHKMEQGRWLHKLRLALACLAVFLFGYCCHLFQAAPASGTTFAELRATHEANDLAYLLDNHGFMGGQYYLRWWETGPLFVQKLCWWLDEKLSDGTPWPT